MDIHCSQISTLHAIHIYLQHTKYAYIYPRQLGVQILIDRGNSQPHSKSFILGQNIREATSFFVSVETI